MRGLQAVHHRHHHIHQDQTVIPFRRPAEHLHRLLPVSGTLRHASKCLQEAAENLHIQGIVLCHEDPRPGKVHTPALLLRRLLHRGLLQPQGKVKPASLPNLAFKLNPAPHQADQTVADGKAQSRSLLARRHRIHLLKAPEDPLLVLFGNADALINNGKIQIRPPISIRIFLHDQPDSCVAFRVLTRIPQKVYQHLAKAQAVTEVPGVRKLDLHGKVLFFLREAPVHDCLQPVQELLHVKRSGGQRHLAALDLGHVQNVIEQSQKVMGGAVHLFQAVKAALLALGFLQRDLRHADDAVHGRPDLVGHTRQELRLGLGRLVVVLLIDAVLDDGADLAQLRTLRSILQKLSREPDQEDIARILPVVRHRKEEARLVFPCHPAAAHRIFVLRILRGIHRLRRRRAFCCGNLSMVSESVRATTVSVESARNPAEPVPGRQLIHPPALRL